MYYIYNEKTKQYLKDLNETYFTMTANRSWASTFFERNSASLCLNKMKELNAHKADGFNVVYIKNSGE